MSRPSLQWCKLYSRLLDDEDFRGMGLAERGVYVGLLCHANRQEPRGTFSIKNMRDLANVVADGDEQILRSTLNYLCVEWLNIEGAPHLVREGDRLRFRTFEEIQRAPSEEPSAIRARKDSYKERKNGNRTEIERAKNGNERSLEVEVDKEREDVGGVGEDGAAAPVIIPLSDIDPRVYEVLDTLRQERSANNVKYVRLKIVEHSQANPVTKALEAHEHVLANPKKYKFPLRVWGNWMKPAKWEQDQKPDVPSNVRPIFPTNAHPDVIHALRIVAAQLPTPEYNAYFGDVTTSQPQGTTVWVAVADKKRRQRFENRFMPMLTMAFHEIHSPLRPQLAS